MPQLTAGERRLWEEERRARPPGHNGATMQSSSSEATFRGLQMHGSSLTEALWVPHSLFFQAVLQNLN